MITLKNLKEVLENLNFTLKGEIYTKKFESFDCLLKVDFKKKVITYPENKGLKINERQTCNLSSNENFVVLECVNRLLEQGYNPAHIELEPKWKVGHGASGGRADVLVRNNKGKSLLIIECKNAGNEFTKHWNETLENGSQLFGYAQQEKDASFLCLYASDLIDNEVKPNYRLITLKDNEQYLEDNPKFESFKDAKVREDLYRVWKNTYQKDFTTKGLFEKDIQAYNIGKKKYSVDDLSLVDSSTKQSKHHAFATILRKYNVSGRENAFDKLVNLFLCKIVDEKNNPNDLQFYWKGIAYDTPFELQDRLQKLYQTGMNEFLKEDVTYIDNQQIDKAFWAFKNDPDATRETIKSYFKQLKFFTNNDFAFIDVHNERLFYENADVLIDIVRLFQDTKIKSDSKNQFLGDMFENFLDGGVKQSEGQFFTPMPITRFIIQSLPLESIISESQKIPKAIDYACGSGHFLNELASQMRPFIEANKEVSLEEYHKAIHGIEKEYRLSKVAKVSAFMYGQDNIDITYADALEKSDKFNSDDYQILVANPPYSVRGFLGTLNQDSKETYSLYDTIDDKAKITNNSIECFFIERAKQLLNSDGVAAIIVPLPFLSNNDSTYQGARSILLEYFHIVGITELSKDTFGKTGTVTITLFIKRRSEKPEYSEHFKNRVDSWFTSGSSKQQIFEDEHYIEEYCNHLEYDFEDYKTFLDGKPNAGILSTEMFEEYRILFDNSTAIKKRKVQSVFKKLSKEEQKNELDRLFLNKTIIIEKEKLYYFILASNNQNEVIIVKAPSDNKASKKFLGYEWSSAKVNAGIKINYDKSGNHITPLYDPTNRYNSLKINYYIQQAFLQKTPEIPKELNKFIGRSNLINMLDFKRTKFDKQLSLTPKKEVSIISKWNLVKIKDICEIGRGRVISKKYLEENAGIYPVYSSQTVNNGEFGRIKTYDFDGEYVTWTTDGENAGTCFYRNEKFNCTNVCGTLKAKNNKILMPYLSDILNMVTDDYVVKVANPKLMNNVMSDIKIPLPDIDVQQKIVNECSALNTEKLNAINIIQKAKDIIENGYQDAFTKAAKKFKLGNTEDFEAFIGRRVLKKEVDTEDATIPIFSANVFDPFGKINKLFIKDFTKPSVLWGIDGDWMVNYIPANLQFYPTDHCGVIRIKTKEVNPRYLTWALNEAGKEKRFSRSHRASTDRIKGISIQVPDIKIQNALEKEIIKQEKIIDKAKKIIETIAERKQAVLKKHL